ncbi:MAG: hypothetical protein ACW98K_03145 [Candidatus Kariarchaeaceae archaeon]
MEKIEAKAIEINPDLERIHATEQLLSYTLHSILMDFHPEDLYIPAMNDSSDVEIKALNLVVPQFIARSFASFLNISNKNSYQTLSFEVRKRLYNLYKSLSEKSSMTTSKPTNSFGYLSQ